MSKKDDLKAAEFGFVPCRLRAGCDGYPWK